MNSQAEDKQFKKMTETPVGRLLRALALPTILSMLVSNVYNLVDAYFVGRINTSASGAIETPPAPIRWPRFPGFKNCSKSAIYAPNLLKICSQHFQEIIIHYA